MALPRNLKIKKDRVPSLLEGLRTLIDTEILVGVPDENADRPPEDGVVEPLTNASLAYIHDTGMPEQNIPARPFMLPGLERAKDKVAGQLVRGAKAMVAAAQAGRDPVAAAESGLDAAGLLAVASIKMTISDGVPPPLADATVRNRARKGRKGAKEELKRRAAGEAPGTELVKPLIDTGEMRTSITYVKRQRRDRK
jgi:hypothetical protein